MSFSTKAIAAAAALITAGGFAASADAAVFLGFQYNNGAIVQKDTDPSVVFYNGAFGGFEVNVYSGTDGIYPQLLGTSGHTRNSAGPQNAGTLDVYVTVTDLAKIPTNFNSSFAVNVLPKKWSVTTRTYANANNALWGVGGTLLSSKTFNGIGVYEDLDSAPLGPGLYSLTARYTIVAPTRGEALATISLAAVPEPATWAMMILGFGAAGAMVRRRRSLALVAAPVRA
jgi:hypothetical protein